MSGGTGLQRCQRLDKARAAAVLSAHLDLFLSIFNGDFFRGMTDGWRAGAMTCGLAQMHERRLAVADGFLVFSILRAPRSRSARSGARSPARQLQRRSDRAFPSRSRCRGPRRSLVAVRVPVRPRWLQYMYRPPSLTESAPRLLCARR